MGTEPPTTTEPCEDDKATTWCENKKQKGKCYKSNIANKCKKTCGVCGEPLLCEDYKPTSWCENKKAKGKCSKNAIKYKCALTCEFCTPKNFFYFPTNVTYKNVLNQFKQQQFIQYVQILPAPKCLPTYFVIETLKLTRLFQIYRTDF